MMAEIPSVLLWFKLVVVLCSWCSEVISFPLDIARPARSSPSANMADVTDHCVNSPAAQSVCLFCDATGMRSGSKCCTDDVTFMSCSRLTSWYMQNYRHTELFPSRSTLPTPSMATRTEHAEDATASDVQAPNTQLPSDQLLRKYAKLFQDHNNVKTPDLTIKRGAVWWSNRLPIKRSIRRLP